MNRASADIDHLVYYEQFIRDRITTLRLSRGLSENQLSLNLGNSRSYINRITSGKMKPSIYELLKICDYFDITPKDFFDDGNTRPDIICSINNNLMRLEDKDQQIVLELTERLKSYKNTTGNQS